MFTSAVRKKDIIGIDLGAEEFIFVQVRRSSGRDELVSLMTYHIKNIPEDDVVKMLHKAFKDSHAKDPFVVCCLPLNLAITKNLEIPSLDPHEIREIIDLQAGRQTPYAREEIIVDYISLGTYRQSYTKILLVIVPKIVIKKQLVLLKNAGVRCDEICFSAEGVAGFCYQQVKNQVRNDPFGIIHVDGQATDMLVCHQGNVLFSRSIPVGASHLALDKVKFTERLVAELRKSLEMYQAEDIDRVFTHLVLTGAEAALADLALVLREQMSMNVIPVAYRQCLFPAAGKTAANNPAFAGSVLGVAAPLVSPQALKVSLLPDEIKLKRAFEIKTRELLKMSVCLVVLLVLLSAMFIGRVYFKGLYLTTLKAQHESVRQEAQILEKAMERIRIIKHYRRNRGYALEVLAAVYDVLPPRIMLTDIKMDTGGSLFLKGTARAMSDVFAFVAKMEEREMFSNVKTDYTTARKQGDEDWADFGVSCILSRREELISPTAGGGGG